MIARKAIAIVHDRDDVLGSLPDLMDEMGIELKIVAVDQSLPKLEDADLFFIMGSPESAHDDSLPWINNELEWIVSLIHANKPMMGICFGSQIIARALGGKAYRLPAPEIGFMKVKAHHPNWRHQGPWLNFHFDTFDLPQKVQILGTTEIAKQSYRYGNCLAVQFHPEIDTDMFDTWIAYWSKSESGLAYLNDNKPLVDQVRQDIKDNEPLCKKNFACMLKDFIESIQFNY